MEIIDDRHRRGSTILTRQLAIEHWHNLIPNPTIAHAIFSRRVRNAHRLLLNEVLPGSAARERAVCTRYCHQDG